MNRTEELNKILDKLTKDESKDLEKDVKELVDKVCNLPMSQFLLLMQVLQEVNKRYNLISK
jgi:hypothetical protein